MCVLLRNQATEASPIGAVFVVCLLLLIVGTLVALGGLPLSTFAAIGALLVVVTMVVLSALLVVGALVVVSAILVGPHKNAPVRRWQQCNLGKAHTSTINIAAWTSARTAKMFGMS